MRAQGSFGPTQINQLRTTTGSSQGDPPLDSESGVPCFVGAPVLEATKTRHVVSSQADAERPDRTMRSQPSSRPKFLAEQRRKFWRSDHHLGGPLGVMYEVPHHHRQRGGAEPTHREAHETSNHRPLSQALGRN
jgi:hypothetical protein